MSEDWTITLVVFLMASSAILLVYMLVSGRRNRIDERLEDLDGTGRASGGLPAAIPPASMSHFTATTLPRMGNALMPSDDEERTLLRSRMLNAGFYSREAMAIFLGAKMLLMLGPAIIGLSLGMLGILPMQNAVLGGACLGLFGLVGPSFWLDSRKAQRQANLRRALPDALDVLVICLEGGLSVPGALRRVSTELQTAHPILASELNIVQREIQLGRSPGEALQQMGIRTDLEELRSLASVITQSERFGASLVKSLRVHADSLRIKRQQQAEEMAQKAATKILFPTVLFIFPAIFVVILGPAVFRILETFSRMQR